MKVRIQQEINADTSGGGFTGWSPSRDEPPLVGFVRDEGPAEDDHLASFKKGYGSNNEHTLIADGDWSEDNKGFKGHHNHYGRKREGAGYFSEDRGHYSGWRLTAPSVTTLSHVEKLAHVLHA